MTKKELKALIQSNPCYAVQAIAMYYEDRQNFDPKRNGKKNSQNIVLVDTLIMEILIGMLIRKGLNEIKS